jgi:hypothetical protein
MHYEEFLMNALRYIRADAFLSINPGACRLIRQRGAVRSPVDSFNCCVKAAAYTMKCEDQDILERAGAHYEWGEEQI